MQEKEQAIVKSGLINGQIVPGSMLSRLLAELPTEDYEMLKMKALEGVLSIELERMKMQDKFSYAQEDMNNIIRTVRELERSHAGKMTYREVKGEFDTATGKTTVTSKSTCYIATYVYEEEDQYQLQILRKYRDEKLKKRYAGRILISIYEFISPKLISVGIIGEKQKKGIRYILDRLVIIIE